MNNLLQVSKPLKKVEDPNPKKSVEEPKEAGKSDTVCKGKKSADTVSIYPSYLLSYLNIWNI